MVKKMITSTSNQQMKKLSLLMKKAKERREQGLFVVEGIKMFREAPAEWIEGVYVSEQFMENPEHEALLSGVTYEVVADSVFKAVSDTQTPQGILALIRMPHYTLEDVMQGEECAGSGESGNDGAHRRGSGDYRCDHEPDNGRSVQSQDDTLNDGEYIPCALCDRG